MQTYKIVDLGSSETKIVKSSSMNDVIAQAKKLFTYYAIETVEHSINRWNMNRGFCNEKITT